MPITSGGTMGNIAYIVFTPEEDGAEPVLTRNRDASARGGIRMAVESGVLVEYIGEYGPEDPFCCPSILRKTSFRWDGSKLVESGTERQPAGQQK